MRATKEIAMTHRATTAALNANDEAMRNAYNSTFAALELDWHWDSATYEQLLAGSDGRQALRAYVQQQRPHLLRAYGVDCLVDAIESTRHSLAR
jgi:hypothetical protein